MFGTVRFSVAILVVAISTSLSAQSVKGARLGLSTVAEIRRNRGEPDQVGQTEDGRQKFISYPGVIFYFSPDDSIVDFARVFPSDRLTRRGVVARLGRPRRSSLTEELRRSDFYGDSLVVVYNAADSVLYLEYFTVRDRSHRRILSALDSLVRNRAVILWLHTSAVRPSDHGFVVERIDDNRISPGDTITWLEVLSPNGAQASNNSFVASLSFARRNGWLLGWHEAGIQDGAIARIVLRSGATGEERTFRELIRLTPALKLAMANVTIDSMIAALDSSGNWEAAWDSLQVLREKSPANAIARATLLRLEIRVPADSIRRYWLAPLRTRDGQAGPHASRTS
jgi:hypothetical protein